MRKILVTGGNGFVGQRVVSELLADGEEVTYTYRSTPIIGTKARGIKLDLVQAKDYQSYEAELQSVTHLIHAAAPVPSRNRKPSAWQDFDEQLVISLTVLRNLLANLPNLRKVVLMSSCYIDNPDPGVGYYGVGKQATEVVLHRFGALSGVSTIAVRFPQLYGPGETHGMYANKFVQQACEGIPLSLEGNAGNKKDLLFIDDAIAAISYTLEQEGQQTITVSSDHAYSAVEVAEEVARQTGIDIVRKGDLVETIAPLHFQSTFSKEDFSLQYPLKEGIAKTISYYKERHV